jgi:multiple sugar transport system ATP-binding protein
LSDLTVRGVTKRFGEVLVLDDLSLTIGAEEFVVVLGPSGCGKSTLLRCIAGLETIDAGEIEMGGRRIDQLPPSRRGVAMVFQSYALYPHMTIRENMAFGLRNVRVARPEIERRIAEAVKMLEIGPLLDRRPSELSGGQRQRAAIGRAIVKAPDVFMFDEPLSNLDAALRSRTRHEIASLHRRIRAAMIFVTHDQTEAMTLADRIVVMNEHRIEQVGAPLEIYSRPATAFVAGFVGSPAMNIVPVERASNGALQAVRLGDGVTVRTRVDGAALPRDGALRLGLRPEAVRIGAPEAQDAKAVVEFVEYLGDRTQIHVRLAGGERMVATTGAQASLRVGETVGVGFDEGAAHLFDASGRAHHPV